MFRDSFGFNGFIVSLKDKGCSLSYSRHEGDGKSGKSIVGGTQFSPKNPCYFLRRHGEVQHFAFPDLKIDGVFIVVSSPMSRTEKRAKNISVSGFCGRIIYGIVISGKSVDIVNDFVAGKQFWCRDLGAEEPLFRTLAQMNLKKKMKKV